MNLAHVNNNSEEYMKGKWRKIIYYSQNKPQLHVFYLKINFFIYLHKYVLKKLKLNHSTYF